MRFAHAGAKMSRFTVFSRRKLRAKRQAHQKRGQKRKNGQSRNSCQKNGTPADFPAGSQPESRERRKPDWVKTKPDDTPNDGILLHGGQKRTHPPFWSSMQPNQQTETQPFGAHSAAAKQRETLRCHTRMKNQTMPKRETPAERKRTSPHTPPKPPRKNRTHTPLLLYAQARVLSSAADWPGNPHFFGGVRRVETDQWTRAGAAVRSCVRAHGFPVAKLGLKAFGLFYVRPLCNSPFWYFVRKAASIWTTWTTMRSRR